jgi:hypothetical protein
MQVQGLSQAKVFSSNQALVDGTSSGLQQSYQVSDSSVGISFLTADSLPTDCIAWQHPVLSTWLIRLKDMWISSTDVIELIINDISEAILGGSCTHHKCSIC